MRHLFHALAAATLLPGAGAFAPALRVWLGERPADRELMTRLPGSSD